MIDTSCLRRLAFPSGVDVVAFVTLSADDSILPIGYTVLIPDDAVAVDQDKSIFALGALSTIVLQTVRIDKYTKSRVDEHIPIFTLSAGLTTVFCTEVDDAVFIFELEGSSTVETSSRVVLQAARNVTGCCLVVIVEGTSAIHAVADEIHASWLLWDALALLK